MSMRPSTHFVHLKFKLKLTLNHNASLNNKHQVPVVMVDNWEGPCPPEFVAKTLTSYSVPKCRLVIV